MESSSRSPDIELWVTSSGTPMRRPSSWRGWKTRPWRRLLSGMTLSSSTAKRGVGRWISSLPDSRASHSHTLGAGRASRTTDGCGRKYGESSVRYDLDTSSWKTFRGLYEEDLPTSSVTLPKGGLMLRGECFPLERSEPHTSERGSSSLLPTPTASRYGRNKGGANPDGKERPSLDTLARDGLIPTPTATDAFSSRSAKYSTDSGRHGGRTLTDYACGEATGTDLRLNPAFVEWMMGLPTGWTDLGAWATESSPSKPQGPSPSS